MFPELNLDRVYHVLSELYINIVDQHRDKKDRSVFECGGYAICRAEYFADESWIEREVVLSPESGVYMPERFLDIAEEIYNFEVRPTDIWVVTFPKCGTTVIQVTIPSLT